MREVVILNERTVFRALWLSARHIPFCLLNGGGVFARLDALLERFCSWLLDHGRADDVEALIRGPSRRSGLYWITMYPGLFARVEPAIRRHYRFSRLDRLSSTYATAIKHSICSHVANRLDLIVQLRELSAQSSGQYKVVGADNDAKALYAICWGGTTPRLGWSTRLAVLATNALVAAAVVIYGVSWCIVRTRLRVAEPIRVKLGVDFVSDERLLPLVLALVDNRAKDLVVVYRSRAQAASNPLTMDGMRTLVADEGRFTLHGAVRALCHFVRDCAILWRLSSDYPPRLAQQVAALAFRRLKIAGLMNRLVVENFWARDDYNADHILRTQELRERRSRSLGMSHGLPAPALIDPIWRYIDFDVYYVFGRYVRDACYHETWPVGMSVRAVGSFALSAKFLSDMPPNRLGDIVFFANPHLHEAKILGYVEQVAKFFPEKKIHVRVKGGKARALFRERLQVWVSGAPRNIVMAPSHTNAYDLMRVASYAICCPSTVVVEAIQLGLSTFVFDLLADEPFYFRPFSSLCVSSADEIIDRIEAIESKRWRYPRESFEALVNMSRLPSSELIAGDMRAA